VLAPPRPVAGDAADAIAALMGKADRSAHPSPDDSSLFGDLFRRVPADGWPAAALTRTHDAGDAGDGAWLRADPAHFRVERANVRLLGCGHLDHTPEEANELVAALSPLFGDEGFELSAPHPDRWYLRAFAGNPACDLPALPPPETALGGDLFEMWPEDATHRRWRGLFNQAQILLAQHAVNRRRIENGKPVINGLWFWGSGRLPAAVRSDVAVVATGDIVLSALAMRAGIPVVETVDQAAGHRAGDLLLDLRAARSSQAALSGLLDAWNRHRLSVIQWRTPEARWILKPFHRWRFWR